MPTLPILAIWETHSLFLISPQGSWIKSMVIFWLGFGLSWHHKCFGIPSGLIHWWLIIGGLTPSWCFSEEVETRRCCLIVKHGFEGCTLCLVLTSFFSTVFQLWWEPSSVMSCHRDVSALALSYELQSLMLSIHIAPPVFLRYFVVATGSYSWVWK